MLVARAELFPRDKTTVRSLSAPVSRDSLFFAEGADWKWQRRAVAPAFRHENLLALVPTFSQCARAQASAWRNSPDAAPIDTMDAMSRATFAVIERTALGEAASLDREEFLKHLRLALASVPWRRTIALFNLPDWTPHPGSFKMRAATAYLYKETMKAVAARRAAGSGQRDILGLLLSARDPETGRVMTNSELTANLYFFLIAGHETSAVALGWSLWLLAKDQASQDRLREEVAQTAGAREIGPGEVERARLSRGKSFKKQCACSRRRRSSDANRARTRRSGRTKSQKCDPIYVAIWCLHRHEKLWEEPNAFDPNRFAPEKVKARNRCAYLPFGAGPRMCIGMGFAMLEMTAILATLIRDFRFKTAPGHRMELDMSFTTRPKGGLPLLIEAL